MDMMSSSSGGDTTAAELRNLYPAKRNSAVRAYSNLRDNILSPHSQPLRRLPHQDPCFDSKAAEKLDSCLSTRSPASPPASAAVSAIQRPSLSRWKSIMSFRRHNEYITTGYRPPIKSVKESLHSLMFLHNETVNIYSHLVGAILFISLPNIFWLEIFPYRNVAQNGDVIVLSIFFSNVSLCFLLSAAFHTICDASKEARTIGVGLDYLGIIALMWGATVASIFYAFYGNWKLRALYWTLVSVLALASSFLTVSPPFVKSHHFRAAMYASLGLSAIGFVVHAIVLYGWEVAYHKMGLGWMGLMALSNFLGVVVYATRAPERWSRRCDIAGSSHQIFHIMVVFAALAHMVGLGQAFSYAHGLDW